MKTYFTSLFSTFIILLIAFIVATISDINDLFHAEIIFCLIILPSIIISALFAGIYRKNFLVIILSILVGPSYIYLLLSNGERIIDPLGVAIYGLFVYLPLIIVGTIFAICRRVYKIRKGIYI